MRLQIEQTEKVKKKRQFSNLRGLFYGISFKVI